ncbi:FmdB family zinc ribbon protein [Cryobacterium sp. Y11]|uniref:FmdB family zinc ribbon protein n=1 Tax=Cryobacterium sp. Y11 TaxID=2045016 RepID=UPI000CE32E93
MKGKEIIIPLYSFRCPDCGEFDADLSLTGNTSDTSCPNCRQMAARVFTAPNFGSRSRALDYAFTQAGRSSEVPEVVRSVPSARRASVGPVRDPRYPRLPKN